MTVTEEVLPLLDPIAFAGALVLAPLAFTAMTFWLLFIPVAALFLGVVPYLVFGGPVFLWMVTHYPPSFPRFAVGGLLAHGLFVICFALWSGVRTGIPPDAVEFMALWGVPFCLGWGGSFAWMYRAFYRSPVR